MIRGIHGLLYSSDAEATRAFFRDRVRLPGTDVGEGWWIFDFPEGDLGVHPVEGGGEPGTHDVSFYCDEIERTVADLESRGVRFTGPVQDHGYGLVTHFEAPGGLRVQLYEPRYTKGTRPQSSGRGAPRSRGGTRQRASKKPKRGGPGRRPSGRR